MHEELNHGLGSHFEILFKRSRLGLSSPHTTYQYRLNLRRFDDFLGRPATIADLRDDVVCEAMNWLLRTKKLSPASVSKFRDNLCCLWRFLSRKRIVDTDPEVPEVKEPRRAPIALTRDQLKRIWDFMVRMPGYVEGIPAADFFCSLTAAFWDTGARKGELFNSLAWDHVDLESGFLVCRAETVKGGLEDRLYRVRPSTVEWLQRIAMPQRRLVWPWPWSETTFYDKLGRIMSQNGLPDTRYYKCHIFRKSVASHLLAEGGDPQRALGHNSPGMTMRHYIDPRIARPPAPCDFLPPIGEPPRPTG